MRKMFYFLYMLEEQNTAWLRY